MSPIRMRKTIRVGRLLRLNITKGSVLGFLRGWSAPWSSVSIGPRGASYNTRRRTARVDLPGPFSWESNPIGLRTRPYGDTSEIEPVAEEDALREPCPYCDAAPGEPCSTRTDRRTDPHLSRVELARTDRHYRTGPWAPDDTVPPWGTPPR